MKRRSVVVNSGWLMADKVVRLGLGLIVWVWLARHFGPETFGLWNYAIAFASLFGALAGLGLEGVLVRELVGDTENHGELMGTGLALRLGAGLVAAAASVIAVAWLRPADHLAEILVALNAAAFVVQSSQVIESHFQSRSHTRPAVLALNAAFLVTTLGRLALLHVEAAIVWYAVTLLIEALLAAVFLVFAYRGQRLVMQRWRVSSRIAMRLIRESWPLLLSSLAVMAYMRLDQIMLSSMVGDAAVGQFSAALRISEVWYFIPMTILTAAFPTMMVKRQQGAAAYETYVQSLYDGMAWLGVGIAAVTSLLAPWIVGALYGESFSGSVTILRVQIWAGVTVAMSFVHGRWLLAEGLQKYGLLYTCVGAVVNIGLNLLLIPRYGAVGSAIATLATQIGLLPLQLVFPKARRNFVLMTRVATAPLRLFSR
jgi:PST family polysaccharide transporter